MTLTWASSGKGECSLSLLDAQHLALDAGFTFKGSSEAMPLARRADLQAMFEHFGVNSLSAFRLKFSAYELSPHAPSTGAGTRAALALPGTSGPGGSTGGRSRWGVQQQLGETYVGELLDGRRHGLGILLTKGERSWVLYVGRFSEGKRNGTGLVATSRGERFEGFFNDDVMWGPGQYTFPVPPSPCAAATDSSSTRPPPAGSDGQHEPASAAATEHKNVPTAAVGGPTQQQQPHRVSFRGMMNGRPAGKGCLLWSDGSRQVGHFDACNCYLTLEEEEVAGVLMVAADNAKEARLAAAEAQQAALRQDPSIARHAQQLCASLDTGGGADMAGVEQQAASVR